MKAVTSRSMWFISWHDTLLEVCESQSSFCSFRPWSQLENSIITRAVKVSALIYAINVAAINLIYKILFLEEKQTFNRD